MSEDNQSWSQYLCLLSDHKKLPNQTLSFVVDQDGVLIYPLNQLDHLLNADSTSKVTHPTTRSLSTHLPLSYQKRFQHWLMTNRTEHIICPLDLEKTIWVCIQLNDLHPSLLTSLQSIPEYFNRRLKLLTITDVTAHHHRNQLLARTSGLLGIKHDLANRLFLFKALPQLLEFSAPKELLEDIQSELPNLLDFFDHRLSEIWTESMPLNHLRSSSEFQTAVESLLHTHQLSKYFTLQYSSDLQDIKFTRPCSFLGLEWSFRYLATLIGKNTFPQKRDIPLLIEIKPYRVDSDALIRGDCHHLLADDVHLCLSLTLNTESNHLLSKMYEGWKTSEYLNDKYSSLRSRSPSQQQSLTVWFDTFVYAAHSLSGVVKQMDQHTLAIIF